MSACTTPMWLATEWVPEIPRNTPGARLLVPTVRAPRVSFLPDPFFFDDVAWNDELITTVKGADAHWNGAETWHRPSPARRVLEFWHSGHGWVNYDNVPASIVTLKRAGNPGDGAPSWATWALTLLTMLHGRGLDPRTILLNYEKWLTLDALYADSVGRLGLMPGSASARAAMCALDVIRAGLAPREIACLPREAFTDAEHPQRFEARDRWDAWTTSLILGAFRRALVRPARAISGAAVVNIGDWAGAPIEPPPGLGRRWERWSVGGRSSPYMMAGLDSAEPQSKAVLDDWQRIVMRAALAAPGRRAYWPVFALPSSSNQTGVDADGQGDSPRALALLKDHAAAGTAHGVLFNPRTPLMSVEQIMRTKQDEENTALALDAYARMRKEGP